MLRRRFADFLGLLMSKNLPVYCQKEKKKQPLSCNEGGADHEYSAMLFRTFAVYIKLELMRSYTIDCAQLTDEGAFWQAYLAATEPEGAGYFGCNLNAFWDALNGGPGWPGECQLMFVNTASLKALHEGRFYQALKEIARDSELVEVCLE